MGLFFNYDKPGPGVDKNAPKKRGIFLYFELLWRNFGKMLLSNIIYFAVSLPISAVYYIFISAILGGVLPADTDVTIMVQTSLIMTLVLVALWGTGPVSCGLTYVLRSFAREEHTWVCSDFFGKSREGFKYGMVFLIVDMAMLAATVISASVYWSLASGGSKIYMLLLLLLALVVIIYTAMHFYMYELEVTFEGGILEIYKNSLIMAMATLPMCILISAIIFFVSMNLLAFLSPIGVLLVAMLCWMSFMRFIVDFYSARVIKKNLISKREKIEESDK